MIIVSQLFFGALIIFFFIFVISSIGEHVESKKFLVEFAIGSVLFLSLIIGLYFGIKFIMYNNYKNNSFSSDLKLEYSVNKTVEENVSSSDLSLLYFVTTCIEDSKFKVNDYEVSYSDINVEIERDSDKITVAYSYVENVYREDLLGIEQRNLKQAKTTIDLKSNDSK